MGGLPLKYLVLGADVLSMAQSLGTLELALLMDEVSGSTLNDDSGNDRDFTLSGSPLLGEPGLSSKSGTAVSWDGSTSYAQASTSALGRLGWSYMFLISPGAETLQEILSWDTSSPTAIRINALKLIYDFNTSGFAFSSNALSLNTPAFVAFSIESDGTPHIYKSAVGGTMSEMSYTTQTADNTADESATTVSIAARDGTSRFLDADTGFLLAWSDVLEASDFQKIVAAAGS